MPEIQKYNLREQLHIADDKYKGSTSLVGMSSLTQAPYINSTRTQMFTSHLKQFLNLINPEFPYVFSNAENTVGKYSSGYKRAKTNLKIIKKIAKYDDILEKPFIYHLFVYNKKKDMYDVVTRKEVEENLTEDFGYQFNNECIDTYSEGDTIKKDTVLFKSNSYDEDMNYRYGVNANVIYCLDPFTSEDAAVVSKSFSEKMTTVKVNKIMWGLNNNDIPLNLYGDEDVYKPYPDIGEYASGMFAASRAQFNEQILYDFKDKNLNIIKDSDRTICYNGTGFVIDYDIYCNNPDLSDNSFNEQILKYLNSQTKYYQEINDVCKEIINSGTKYSREIDYLYKRSSEFLNPDTKWKDESVFGNLKIRVTIAEYVPLKKGHKFTGRYGNKSVVSKVVDDSEMPYTEDGKRVDVKMNLLAIINRTTGFVPHELFITFICMRAREQMEKAKTFKEKEKILFDIINDLNKKQHDTMFAYYNKLSDDEKKDYIDSAIKDGIYIHQNPVEEDEFIFYKLIRMKEKYDWLQPYQMYKDIDGQAYPQLCKTYLGQMYLIRLKQIDIRQFSGRNSGAINTKELPERSYKNRSHQELHSDTAIRMGEYETLAFLAGLSEEEIALFHAYYRTSIKGRKDLIDVVFKPQSLAKIDKSLTSRVVEIFSVIFKYLSLEVEFFNEDDILYDLDSHNVKEQTYDGKVYMMTDYDFYVFKQKEEIKKSVLEKFSMLTGDELKVEIEKALNSSGNILGEIREEIESPDDEVVVEEKK